MKTVGPEKGVNYTSKEGYWAKSDAIFSEIDPKEVCVTMNKHVAIFDLHSSLIG